MSQPCLSLIILTVFSRLDRINLFGIRTVALFSIIKQQGRCFLNAAATSANIKNKLTSGDGCIKTNPTVIHNQAEARLYCIQSNVHINRTQDQHDDEKESN